MKENLAEMSNEQLNILVAEKVLGWTPLEGKSLIDFEKSGRPGNPEDNDRWHNRRIWVLDGKKMACEECGDMPSFSGSISDAWELVEFMAMPKSIPRQVTIDAYGDEFRVSFGRNDEDDYAAASNPNPARAISLTALKACGVKLSA